MLPGTSEDGLAIVPRSLGRWVRNGALLTALLCSCGPRATGVQEPVASGDGNPSERPTGPEGDAASRDSGAEEAAPGELPPLLHPVRDSAWLGVEMKDLEGGVAGVRVERVFRGSPAASAGVEPGDVMLSLDGQTLTTPQQVTAAVRSHRPGTRLSLLLSRQGQQKLLSIELTNQPEAEDLVRLHFIGLPAPKLRRLATVQGDGTWERLEGEVLVVEFWAGWCVACRYVVPVMNRWHRRFRPQGATLLGITSDPVAMADRTVRELGMAYAVASDPSGETIAAFSAHQLPTLFVVDRQGIVRDVMVGLSEQRLQDLERLLERLLDES